MSCAQAQDLVASRGAITLSTGEHTYARYAATAEFCSLGEYAYRRSAPTRDTPNCPLGYVCKTDTPLFNDGFDIRGQ